MSHFDNPACTTLTDLPVFGLHDPENGGPARLVLTDGQPRNCTVRNPNGHACRFIAIDNCLEFKDEEGNTLRTCDCALVYADEVLVVELKHKRKNQWVALGVEQL